MLCSYNIFFFLSRYSFLAIAKLDSEKNMTVCMWGRGRGGRAGASLNHLKVGPGG